MGRRQFKQDHPGKSRHTDGTVNRDDAGGACILVTSPAAGVALIRTFRACRGVPWRGHTPAHARGTGLGVRDGLVQVNMSAFGPEGRQGREPEATGGRRAAGSEGAGRAVSPRKRGPGAGRQRRPRPGRLVRAQSLRQPPEPSAREPVLSHITVFVGICGAAQITP